jgi:hypothetical protein
MIDSKDVPWLPPEFYANQEKFTPEMLLPYAGSYVAYSWDGSRILASGPDEENVEQQLREMGVDPARVVLGYVPDL